MYHSCNIIISIFNSPCASFVNSLATCHIISLYESTYHFYDLFYTYTCACTSVSQISISFSAFKSIIMNLSHLEHWFVLGTSLKNSLWIFSFHLFSCSSLLSFLYFFFFLVVVVTIADFLTNLERFNWLPYILFTNNQTSFSNWQIWPASTNFS